MLRTFEDLNKVKDNYWENKKEKTLIKVSMSTCGITAGADTIYNYFQVSAKTKKAAFKKHFLNATELS